LDEARGKSPTAGLAGCLSVAAAPAEIQQLVKALQPLRGVAKLVAESVVAEVGKLSRFPHARERWATADY
jgi:hypothetical protein